MIELALDKSERKVVIREYSIYYGLMRSGLFKLNLFDYHQTFEEFPLPAGYVYPDVICWPFGIYQVYDDYLSTLALLFPQPQESLKKYYADNGHGSLPSEAKKALVETLSKIHQAGYVHDDISLDTIYVNPKNGVAMFTRFYSAYSCDDDREKATEMMELQELF